MNELHEFIKENRKSFPNYFRTKELKDYYSKGELHLIRLHNKIIGFYVLSGRQFKSFYINKNYRKTGITEMTMRLIQSRRKYLTIALNKNSRRMVKFANKFGFVETSQNVKGKTYDLTIFEYKS